MPNKPKRTVDGCKARQAIVQALEMAMPGLKDPSWGDGWTHNPYHYHGPLVDLILGGCEGNDTFKDVLATDIDNDHPSARPEDIRYDAEANMWVMKIFITKNMLLDRDGGPPQVGYVEVLIPDWFVRTVHEAVLGGVNAIRIKWSW